MKHKAGFVNIIGNPNVGKSTLMNSLVGANLSIITSKAQTTRHRILGLVNGDDFQIVYSDTPGLLKPNYKLQESMMRYISSALKDADVFLVIVEIGQKSIDSEVIEHIKQTGIPVLLLINKIDLTDQEATVKAIEHWEKQFKGAEIIPISALHKFNLQSVIDRLLELLPESPAYYPKDELTDKSMRFFISEIIREKVLLNFKKEVPYSAEVVVEEFKEEEKIIKIKATIFVARESQRKIMIGHNGAAIKRLGTAARKDIQEFVDNHVFLDLTIKVDKDWRNDDKALKKYGYEQE
ncbi:MAG: GTPase Era [Bacteroidota bacterium]|nr:GTPase Era [Bacteroidota bacterium]